MDVVEPQQNQPPGRKAERIDVNADVQFRCGTRRATVKVSNISVTGARISGVFLVREGDHFFIKFGAFEPIEAEVAWAEDFAFGCRFMRPLHPAVLERIATG